VQILNSGQQGVPAGLTQLSTDELKYRAAVPYFSYGIEENGFLVLLALPLFETFPFHIYVPEPYILFRPVSVCYSGTQDLSTNIGCSRNDSTFYSTGGFQTIECCVFYCSCVEIPEK
jgi:hypothetical protein